MTRDKLIELAREYIELPEDTEQIEYDCYNGSSSLTFYNDVDIAISHRTRQYIITVTLTGSTLEIKATAAAPDKDNWYKIIEL